MSARELAWRAQGMLRDHLDRPRIAAGLIPGRTYDAAGAERVLATGVPLCDREAGRGDAAPARERWRKRLLPRAQAIAAHRLTFFTLQGHPAGDPIRWNFDHEAGVPTPTGFAQAIDYRDARVAGDAKVVWEPGRHQHLVVLGRAYRVTGDAAYAREAVAQIESWLDQCPFGTGMHWRSPLELAIRTINWIWLFDLIRPSGALSGEPAARIINALHLHLWEIARKYSQGSSANNHRIGEAAGVFIAATCLPGLKGADQWARESRAILEEEIHAQTYDDGGSREQAFGYHVFVLQFLTLAAVAARRSGTAFSSAFHERLARMFRFTAAMTEGGPAPTYGDGDDGYVIDLGGNSLDPREWLPVGAHFLNQPDLAWDFDEHGETADWLLGKSADTRTASAAETRPALRSQAFAGSGRYLLQYGERGDRRALSVLFDCGDFGFGAIAAHGHADSLAFTVRAFGTDLLIDPGTYDYFRYPEWRDYFRGTRAHNTIAVDGLEQSVAIGPFMWGARAQASCTAWEPRPDGGRVEGTHDGYTRLPDPVTHVRALDLDGPERSLTIADRLIMAGAHQVELFFQFAAGCVVRAAGGTIEVSTPLGSARLEVDSRLTASVLHGSTSPPGGWVSHRYHHKSPATTVVLAGRFSGETTLMSRLVVGVPIQEDISHPSKRL